MIAFAFYLLKVVICSGILFMYYHVGLRNKVFHQWNRFYLLIAVVLSLVLPLVQVTLYNYANEEPVKALQVLQAVQFADQYMEEITITASQPVNYDQWILLAYSLVSVVLLMFLVKSLIKIIAIVRTHTVRRINNIRFVDTQVPGTPFSFFDFIFWNREIDLQSPAGQHIFQHELVHVREKHSFDKIFMQLVLMIFWCNPFFWLMRRELKFIHEFIADKKSVGEYGSVAFAAMILQSAYPKQFNSIANPFFQTSIKRRLAMLTRIQNPGINYISRVAALLIIVITTFAFTIRTKDVHRPLARLEKELTVVIDAGHGVSEGGQHNGASFDEMYEDDIVLAIAKKVKELNGNDKLRIVLSRPSRSYVDLKKRTEIATAENADLFISIHLNASPLSAAGAAMDDKKNGIDIYLPSANPAIRNESEALGSALLSELGSLYKVNSPLKTRTAGVYVLNSSACPAVLVECGYITNQKDRSFISKAENREAIALKILSAIERYASAPKKVENVPTVNDTLPGQSYRQEEPVLKKVEIEAAVDVKSWRKFLEDNLTPIVKENKDVSPGSYTVLVKFIVHKDGSLSDFSVVNDPGYGLDKKVLAIMDKAPKWKPAMHNGKTVSSYHTQPIQLVFAKNTDGKKDNSR